MKINASKKDLIWSYIGRIFSYTNQLLLLPIIMIFLSGEELGLWYIFLSIGGIVNLFSFGFNPTFCRNIAYAWSGVTDINKKGRPISPIEKTEKINWDLFSRTVKACRWIYLIIALLALFVLLFIGTFYVIHVSGDFNRSILLFAWIAYSLSVFFTLLFSYYDALLLGMGKIALSQKASIYSKIIQFVLTTVLLFFNLGIIAVSIAALGMCLAYRLLLNHYFLNEIKKYSVKINQWGNPKESVPLLKKFWPNAWRDGLVQISSYLSTQASTLVCSLFFSLEMTGIYSICVQVASAIVNFAHTVYGTMQPTVQSAVARNDDNTLQNAYSISIVCFWLIAITGTIILLTVGIPILNLIKPEYHLSHIFCTILLLYYVLFQHQRLNASFISNFNMLPYVKSFIISSMISIALSYIAMKFFPAYAMYALVFSQLAVQSIYNNWKWPQEACKLVHLSYLKSLKTGIQILRAKLCMR